MNKSFYIKHYNFSIKLKKKKKPSHYPHPAWPPLSPYHSHYLHPFLLIKIWLPKSNKPNIHCIYIAVREVNQIYLSYFLKGLLMNVYESYTMHLETKAFRIQIPKLLEELLVCKPMLTIFIKIS